MDEAALALSFLFNNKQVLTRLHKLHKFNFNAGHSTISVTLPSTWPNKTQLPSQIRVPTMFVHG